jgi:3-deoxy-manno-octulosonate cytidylyltransferase (CMP-KDO synthetase)
MDFYNSEPTLREKNEKLEQLRYLERGKKIKMILTNYKSVSIDVMDDLIVARKIINAYDS